MPSAITIDDSDVLLAIDLQADFMPGGALAVDASNMWTSVTRPPSKSGFARESSQGGLAPRKDAKST